jgi:prevent-host-death family protein
VLFGLAFDPASLAVSGGAVPLHLRRAQRTPHLAGVAGLRRRLSGHIIVVMKRNHRMGRPASDLRATRASRSIAAASFKARCLELMDRVRETGAEYVVTKHGEPVAKLVPYSPVREAALFGSMKGTVLRYERPFDPIDGEWDVNA